MKYRLTLEATNQEFDNFSEVTDGSFESSIELSFPVDATFSTNMVVGNALRELVQILLGEVVQKFEKIETEE